MAFGRARDERARALAEVGAEPLRPGQDLRPGEQLELVEERRRGAALGDARVAERHGGERGKGGELEHLALAPGERGVEQDHGAERLVARAHLHLGDDAGRHLHRAAFEALGDVALDHGQAALVRRRRGDVGGRQDDRHRAGELLGGQRRDRSHTPSGQHGIDHAQVDLAQGGYVRRRRLRAGVSEHGQRDSHRMPRTLPQTPQIPISFV